MPDLMGISGNGKHLEGTEDTATPAKTIKPSGSEVLEAVGNVAQDRAWEVMDELMDTLKIVNEKAYNSFLKKLT